VLERATWRIKTGGGQGARAGDSFDFFLKRQDSVLLPLPGLDEKHCD